MVCVGCSRIEAFILSPCQDKLCIKCILSVAENCRKCPGCLKQIHSINSIDASDHCVSFTWSSLQWKVCLAPNDSVKDIFCNLLRIPEDRLKIVAKGGRVVLSYEEMKNGDESYKVIGTPANKQLPRSSEWFALLQHGTETTLSFFIEFATVLYLFVVSMSPWSRPKFENAERLRMREEQRNQIE